MAQGQSGFMRIKPLELGLATLLTNIAKVVGNYGIAIIILTIFVSDVNSLVHITLECRVTEQINKTTGLYG